MSDLPHCPTTQELADRLTAPLGSKDRFGSNGAAVLVTAGLVAAANASWDKGTIGTFQDNQKLHPKVWDKLVAIARSENVKGLPEKSLPASYTAIYALVVMSDEEFSAAVAEEDLVTAGASSRSLLDWTKAYRLRGTGIGNEVPLTLVLPDDLTPQQHKSLLSALKETAAEFGAQVLEGKGGIKQAGMKADRRKALASEIEEHLMQEIASVVSGAPEDLKTRFGIRSASDLIEGPKATFTGFFQNLVGKVKIEFWRQFGRSYLLKIARDFNLTDSRAERFQLKKRILDVFIPTWGPQIAGFDAMADEVLTTYMSK
jgi:hypothetical protein